MDSKKGVIRLGEAPTLVLVLVTIAIFLAVGALVLAEIQGNSIINGDQTNSSVAFNATQGGLQGLETLASFQTVIAVVIAAALILGVVFLIRA